MEQLLQVPSRQRWSSTETREEVRFFTLGKKYKWMLSDAGYARKDLYLFVHWALQVIDALCQVVRSKSHLVKSKLWQQSPAPAASLSILMPERSNWKQHTNLNLKKMYSWFKKRQTCAPKNDEPDASVDNRGSHGAPNELPHCSPSRDFCNEHPLKSNFWWTSETERYNGANHLQQKMIYTFKMVIHQKQQHQQQQ